MSGRSSPEMPDERRDVVGHQPDVERPIDVGRPAVALEVGHDDLVVGGVQRDDRVEQLAREEAAVQEDQRAARAVCLVVEVEAVDVGVLPGVPVLSWPARGSHCPAPRNAF
jgi:hypothetical protein